jgi:hypothetical protein
VSDTTEIAPKREPLLDKWNNFSHSVRLLIISTGVMSFLAVVVFVIAYRSITNVLTCPATATNTNGSLGDDESGYTMYWTGSSSVNKNCISSSTHATWIPSSLGALAVVALLGIATLGIVFLIYVGRRYQLDRRDRNGCWHHANVATEHFWVTFLGLLFGAGIFGIASVLSYCYFIMPLS